MEIRYEKHWSGNLNREMEFKIYGSHGKPVLFIPCQAGRFWDFESFHMIDYWARWIEEGKCMVFACDTIDNEAWAAQGADNRWRIENHERWFHYIVDELVPAIKHIAGMANGHDQGILTFGASMALCTPPTCITAGRTFSTVASPSPACTTTRNSSAITAMSWSTTIAPACTCKICPTTTTTRVCTTARSL